MHYGKWFASLLFAAVSILSTAAFANTQSVYVLGPGDLKSVGAAPSESQTLEVFYSASSAGAYGVEVQMCFDSAVLELSFAVTYTENFLAQGLQADTANKDSDADTDTCMVASWVSFSGNFDGGQSEFKLGDLQVTNISGLTTGSRVINSLVTGTASGFVASAVDVFPVDLVASYILGTAGDDVLVGSASNDSFNGLDGSDEIYGQGGDDTITISGKTGSFADTIDGGSGTDSLIVNLAGANSLADFNIEKSQGYLTLASADGSVIQFKNIESLTVGGITYEPTGTATDNYNVVNGFVSTSARSLFLYPGDNPTSLSTASAHQFEQIFGTKTSCVTGDYTIFGSSADETLNLNVTSRDGSRTDECFTGGWIIDLKAGNDVIHSAKLINADSIDLGPGNDSISVMFGTDAGGFQSIADADLTQLNGGDGADTIRYDESTNSPAVLYLDTSGASNFENLVGSPDAETIFGNNSSNVLAGGNYGGSSTVADTLNGEGGDDLLMASYNSTGLCNDCFNFIPYDTPISNLFNRANYETFSYDSSSYISSSASHVFNGGEGDDVILGGKGDETFKGGRGKDYMHGGLGSDTFVVRPGDGSALMSDADVVYDFTDGDDVIGLECINYSDLTIEQGDGNYSNHVSLKYGSEYLLIVHNTNSVVLSAPDFSTIAGCDADGDGVKDHIDAFPNDASETLDTDSDGTGNNADTDDDGDGVADGSDTFPLDSAESVDSDGDGTGDNADTDDDEDGVEDDDDVYPLDATLWSMKIEDALAGIADDNLRACLTEKANGVSAIQVSEISEIGCVSQQINDLNGLANFEYLSAVDLRDNQIEDLSVLSSLVNLTRLDLWQNRITELSALSSLARLSWLNVDNNLISDLTPLSGLSNLEFLDLRNNELSNLSPLSSLSKLNTLYLAGNQVSDLLPLANLISLTSLNLRANQVSDLTPIAGLTGLTGLSVAENQIQDISALAGLTGLTGIYLNKNQIVELLPLSSLTGLILLDVSNNKISDISQLITLTQLTYLDLGDNRISDFSPISDLVPNLTDGYFNDNQFIDSDADGVADEVDNCPNIANADQLDTDSDGLGNACDADDDGDGVLDTNDTYPLISLDGLTDTDSDGEPDSCDSDCLATGMVDDFDDDNDGVTDDFDAYPLISVAGRLDTDLDGRPDDCDSACISLGMAADLDDDDDGVLDDVDGYPLINLGGLLDTDGDGRPDDCDSACEGWGMAADPDDDGDGVLDADDAFVLIPLSGRTDTDGDGRPDDCDSTCKAAGMAADADDDDDGVLDADDAFVLIPLSGRTDTDGDGRPDDCDSTCKAAGMAADLDDDDDGVLDAADWVQRGSDIDGEAANDLSGISVPLSADGSVVAIGARGNDGNGIDNSGHVRLYAWNGSSWVQRGSDIDGEAANDLSGWSVSLSADGSVVAIGAYRNDGNGIDSGHVRLYAWNGSSLGAARV